MSLPQPNSFPGMFDPGQGAVTCPDRKIPPRRARNICRQRKKAQIALRWRRLSPQTGAPVPKQAAKEPRRMSEWIDAHSRKSVEGAVFTVRRSSKAGLLCRTHRALKPARIPQECFRDRQMMSTLDKRRKHKPRLIGCQANVLCGCLCIG